MLLCKLNMVKIVSWNVNSIRKGVIKHLEGLIKEHNPDIICFQETKGVKKDIEPFFTFSAFIKDYKYRFYNDSVKGHAGVAVWSKIKPKNVVYDVGGMVNLACGRVIHAEFDDFNLLNTYVPNSGTYVDRRYFWHECMIKYLDSVEKDEIGRMIWCGDLNVVDEPALDTSHHKKRPEKGIIPAGLKDFEKDQFEIYKKYGLVDVFRTLHPEDKSFTWYSPKRSDVGWRLDYFMVGNEIIHGVKNILHGPKLESTASDHTWVIFEN